jgi:inorganic pyrophosphatase
MAIEAQDANCPWHKVDIGEDAPKRFNVIIEIPMGSSNKYELDRKTGLFRLESLPSQITDPEALR